MRPDEHRWHGSAEALARRIAAAADELMELVDMAEEILQHEATSLPWDQWQRAVDAAQDVWSELTSAGETRENIRYVCLALGKSDLDRWIASLPTVDVKREE